VLYLRLITSTFIMTMSVFITCFILVDITLHRRTLELNCEAHHALSFPRKLSRLSRFPLCFEESRIFLSTRGGRSCATPGIIRPGCTTLNSVDPINISKESRQYWYASCLGIELWMPSEYSESKYDARLGDGYQQFSIEQRHRSG
jgi:hypothetical protein